MADKIKTLIALLLLVAGVVGFYVFSDAPQVARVISIIFGMLAAVGVFWTTTHGKRFFGFAKDSANEVKRVVWPTRKETVQTTGVVILFTLAMALFLWAVDAGLVLIVSNLIGREN